MINNESRRVVCLYQNCWKICEMILCTDNDIWQIAISVLETEMTCYWLTMNNTGCHPMIIQDNHHYSSHPTLYLISYWKAWDTFSAETAPWRSYAIGLTLAGLQLIANIMIKFPGIWPCNKLLLWKHKAVVSIVMKSIYHILDVGWTL